MGNYLFLMQKYRTTDAGLVYSFDCATPTLESATCCGGGLFVSSSITPLGTLTLGTGHDAAVVSCMRSFRLPKLSQFIKNTDSYRC